MHKKNSGAIIIVIILTLFFSDTISFAGSGSTENERPSLEAYQGRYFKWACPQGWGISETTNGVTLTAPDGNETASFAILMRSRGQNTPKNFLMWMLRQLPGYSDIRITGEKQLPDQPSGIPGTKWRVAEIKVSCRVNSQPVTGLWTCGINSYYGFYDATVSGFQASVSKWDKSSQYLPAILGSIKITNPRQVAGNDQLIPAKNNPLDNSALIETWKQKGLSEDRISQARREGTSGYERMKDSATGRIYEMPLETYDGAAGGYRNPVRPHEILVKPDTGE